MPVTQDQARALAPLIAASRPHGARRWDEPGIVAAIGRVRDRSLPEVIRAATRAAEDRTAETPGVLAATNSIHWRERALEPPPPERVPTHELCSVCSETKDRCERLWADDHTFLPRHATRPANATAARAALKEHTP